MINRRNRAIAWVGETFWGGAGGLVLSSTVLTVFLKENGASSTMIGSISSIELGSTMLQGIGLFIFASRHNRKRDVLAWHLYAIIPFWFLSAILASFAPHLRPVIVRCGLLTFYGGYMAGLGISGAAFMDWFAHVFNERERGTVLGTGVCFAALASMGGTLLAGRLIGLHPAPNAFTYLYFAAGAVGVTSIIVYWQVNDPEHTQQDTPHPTIEEAIRYARASLSSRNFRRLLVSRCLAMIGFCMVPFITVHFLSKEGGSLPSKTVVSCGSAIAVGWAASSFVFGRLGDRTGHMTGVFLGMLIQIAALAVLLWGSGMWSCLAAFAGAGVCLGAVNVAYANAQIETCPHDNRFAHITIGNLIVGSVGIVAPLLGGLVAEHWSVRTLFMGCFCISIVGLVWHSLFVRDPRRESGRHKMAPA